MCNPKTTISGIVLIVAVVLISMGGCSTARLDQLASEVEQIKGEIVAQLAELPPMGEGSPSQDKARELLEQAAVVADETLAGVADARQHGVIATIADAVIPFVPAPWRELILTIGSIGGVLESRRRKARGLSTLAQSTVDLARIEPTVAHAISMHSGQLRKVQSAAAQRAIDQAQRSSILPVAGG